MKVDVKFRNYLSVDTDNNQQRILYASGEVFIWRDGNEYAVELTTRQELPAAEKFKSVPEVDEGMEEEFILAFYRTARRIHDNWILVDMNVGAGSGYGKVIGQRKITDY